MPPIFRGFSPSEDFVHVIDSEFSVWDLEKGDEKGRERKKERNRKKPPRGASISLFPLSFGD